MLSSSVVQLPAFGVAHVRKDAAGKGMSEHDVAWLSRSGFFLDTCLRQIAILPVTTSPQPELETDIEWLTDRAGYSFLLQTATGLNSAIAGESNILGQFKHGWARWQTARQSEMHIQLADLMTQLFADSAYVRQQHLHGIGGHSYGSLVRKMLKAPTDANILIVGAGDLSQSIRPYLANFELGIWNRTRVLQTDVGNARIFAPDEAARAAGWASHIVITAPADASNDAFWHRQLHPALTCVIHLGLRKASRGVWANLPAALRFADLDDVFGLRSSQSTIRSLKVGYARKACQLHAARIRFTGGDRYAPAIAQRA